MTISIKCDADRHIVYLKAANAFVVVDTVHPGQRRK